MKNILLSLLAILLLASCDLSTDVSTDVSTDASTTVTSIEITSSNDAVKYTTNIDNEEIIVKYKVAYSDSQVSAEITEEFTDVALGLNTLIITADGISEEVEVTFVELAIVSLVISSDYDTITGSDDIERTYLESIQLTTTKNFNSGASSSETETYTFTSYGDVEITVTNMVESNTLTIPNVQDMRLVGTWNRADLTTDEEFLTDGTYTIEDSNPGNWFTNDGKLSREGNSLVDVEYYFEGNDMLNIYKGSKSDGTKLYYVYNRQ